MPGDLDLEANILDSNDDIFGILRDSVAAKDPCEMAAWLSSLAVVERRLVAAKSKLDTAVNSLKSIKRRNDLVHEFYKKTKLSQIAIDGKEKKPYLSAKEDAECRSILLRWILQQIPLIELELCKTKVADNNSLDGAIRRSCDRAHKPSEEQSSERKERKRSHHDDSADDKVPSKRPRYNGQRSSFSARKTPNTGDGIPTRRSQKSGTTASRVVRGRKLASGKAELTTGEVCGVKSYLSTVNSLQLRKNNSTGVSNRRSVRIAEGGERLRAAVVAPSEILRMPREGTAKLTRAPTPPSSTESQKRKSRSKAVKTSKRGRPRRGDSRNTAKPQGISKRKSRPRQ